MIKSEKTADTNLGFLITPGLIVLILGQFCSYSGFGTMKSTCTVDFLEPLHENFIGLVFFGSFLGVFLIPLFLFAFFHSSKYKIQRFKIEGIQGLIKNPIGLLVWTISLIHIVGFVMAYLIAYGITA